MQKSKKKLFDTNDSIHCTPEDTLKEWNDELDEIDRARQLEELGIHTIHVEITDDDYEEWCKYMQKFYKEMERRDIEIEIEKQKSLSNVRPTWNDMYMELAEVVAKRSKDPHTKVGAVLVKDNRILGIGYNAEPKNFTYNFDWNSDEKYDYVIHAELNAIANATFFGNSIEGSTIYLTLSPCHECMKLLVQYGIKTVYYKTEYKDFALTKKIAKFSNINLIKYYKD